MPDSRWRDVGHNPQETNMLPPSTDIMQQNRRRNRQSVFSNQPYKGQSAFFVDSHEPTTHDPKEIIKLVRSGATRAYREKQRGEKSAGHSSRSALDPSQPRDSEDTIQQSSGLAEGQFAFVAARPHEPTTHGRDEMRKLAIRNAHESFKEKRNTLSSHQQITSSEQFHHHSLPMRAASSEHSYRFSSPELYEVPLEDWGDISAETPQVSREATPLWNWNPQERAQAVMDLYYQQHSSAEGYNVSMSDNMRDVDRNPPETNMLPQPSADTIQPGSRAYKRQSVYANQPHEGQFTFVADSNEPTLHDPDEMRKLIRSHVRKDSAEKRRQRERGVTRSSARPLRSREEYPNQPEDIEPIQQSIVPLADIIQPSSRINTQASKRQSVFSNQPYERQFTFVADSDEPTLHDPDEIKTLARRRGQNKRRQTPSSSRQTGESSNREHSEHYPQHSSPELYYMHVDQWGNAATPRVYPAEIPLGG